MSQGFWKDISPRNGGTGILGKGKPIVVLAPMADVTDAAFRRVIARYGKPDAMFTEFVSADGLFLADETGKAKIIKDLLFSDTERPIVAQFFTAKPDLMERAAKLAVEMGFDGVDINMGCPDRSIEKQGAGASLMKNPKLAQEIIRAAKRGAGKLPVSIKTRIGYNKNEIETWLPALLSENPVVVTVHARTRKEMSKVPAHWEVVKRAVEIRDSAKSETLIFGNGDALGMDDAEKKAKETGADGIMLGKAIFGNPFLFAKEARPLSVDERLTIMVEHTKLFEELLGGAKSFSIMKKHYKAYVHGFDGAKELRVKLMEAEGAKEIESLVKEFLQQKTGL